MASDDVPILIPGMTAVLTLSNGAEAKVFVRSIVSPPGANPATVKLDGPRDPWDAPDTRVRWDGAAWRVEP